MFFFSGAGTKPRASPPAKQARFAIGALLALVLVLGGCENTITNTLYPDNYLNLGLTGTWQASGEGWTDTYTITAGAISHPDGWPEYEDARIAWVYNFSNSAGCVIIQRVEDGKYTAVYFKDLSADSVLLGDAYTAADDTQPVEAGTLDEAKEKFAPANAERYGGGSAQAGTPQTKR
ncbi:MAG: hypothetical protein MdMp014T_0987 [Treponematales bacterium]